MALESDTRSARRPLLSNDERHVLRLLRDVSMGAGVRRRRLLTAPISPTASYSRV